MSGNAPVITPFWVPEPAAGLLRRRVAQLSGWAKTRSRLRMCATATPPYRHFITCKTDAKTDPETNTAHEGFSLTAHLAGCAAVAVTAAFRR